MALREEFAHTGNRLFKLRSEFPLVVLLLVLLELYLAPPPLLGRTAELAWAACCLLIAAIGEVIRAYTVGHVPSGTSARSTRQPRGGALNTSGFYSVVRHPLYLGNFLIWLGLVLYVRSWRLDIIVLLLFWLFYERVMYAEEDYLRVQFGDEYLRWAEHTPAFIPALHGWRRPDLPFSWRVVLRREHSSMFAIIAMLTFLVYARDFLDGDWHVTTHTGWLVLLAVCFVPFMVAVRLTRKTRVLDVEGR
jgi:protein-S-isoprenylcysteine O-methyltransferase Ste14